MRQPCSKTWRKDYRWEGKRQTFTIGPYPQVRLADARRRVIDIAEWLRDGIAPRTQCPSRRREAQTTSRTSFREVAETWFHHHRGTWSARHQRDMREKLDNFVLPALAELPIDRIERSHIEEKLLAPILSRGSNQQARRCNDVARRVIEHAIDLDHCRDNPAVKTRRVIAPTRVQHYSRLSWVELPELLRVMEAFEVEQQAHISSLIALKLMLRTLVRPSELREARWSEIDFAQAQWVIPQERMKTRVRHIVPLAPQALALLRQQHQITGATPYVFYAQNHRDGQALPVMSSGCLSMLLNRMGFKGRQPPHGFRGFGQTNCIEQLKVLKIVTEKQLAHTDASSVSRAYDWAEYLDERVDMMRRWADLLDRVAVTHGVSPLAAHATGL